MPISLLLIEPVDNRLLSVDNGAGLGITLTSPFATPYARYWTVPKNPPYILYKCPDFSVILANLARLSPPISSPILSTPLFAKS